MTLTNQNQKYSQKAIIKFLNLAEEKNENLWSKLCIILKEAVKIDLDPNQMFSRSIGFLVEMGKDHAL